MTKSILITALFLLPDSIAFEKITTKEPCYAIRPTDSYAGEFSRIISSGTICLLGKGQPNIISGLATWRVNGREIGSWIWRQDSVYLSIIFTGGHSVYFVRVEEDECGYKGYSVFRNTNDPDVISDSTRIRLDVE